MWRLKTNEELIKEGWKLLAGVVYPRKARAFPISKDMRVRSIDMPYDMIQAIVENRIVQVLGSEWSQNMFIFDTPQALVCQCQWNRHPLYCSCPGKDPIDLANIDQIVAMSARTLEPLRLDPLDIEDDEEEEDIEDDYEDYEEDEDDEEEDYPGP